MKGLSKSFLFLFFSFIGCVVSAQLYEITRYADDSGLPSRIVRDVVQDNKGFIWVAGNNGLYRFDGREFYPYLASLKDTVGLRDNQINTVLRTTDSKIWVGTPKGLHVLENNAITHVPLKEKSTREQEHIISLFEDSAQNIWIGTYRGLFLIEKSKEPIHFLDTEGNGLVASDAVWAITEDEEGNIWIATNHGPYIKKKTQNQLSFTKTNLILDKNLQNKTIGYYQFQQYEGDVYLIDSNIGLLRGQFKEDTLSIRKFKDELGNEFPEYAVDKSIIGKDKKIWVAYTKESFKKYQWFKDDLKEEEIVSRNGFLELSGDVRSIYQDSQKNIWIANTNGLYKLSEYRDGLITFPPRYDEDCLEDLYGIYAILEDKAGYFWVMSPHTLYRFKKEDILSGSCPEKYLEFKDPNMQLSRNLFIDSKNRLWVGADGGLFVSQLDENQNPIEFHRYTKADGLPHDTTYEVYEIAPDNYWVGTYAGLVKMELVDGIEARPKIQLFESDESNPESLVNSYMTDIEQDALGNYWLGTFSGVSRVVEDKQGVRFANYTSTYGNNESLSNNSIKKILKDSNGDLWIATQRGLNKYLPETDSFLRFGHNEGLPSEYTLGIQEDSKGFFWICTTNGVLKAKYDSISRQFVERTHYTSQNGLVDNIPYRNSIHIDKEDNVFIGSRDGITIFKNRAIDDEDESDLKLALIGLERIGKKGKEFNSILERLNHGSFELNHSENSIRIKYVALDFVNPKSNKYRHKFLSSGDTWVETGNNAELTFYNMSPGDYDLLLDASNSRGQWSDAPIHVKFSISPPFWKSNWAYALYILLFLALLRYLYIVRVKQKEREYDRKAQIQTAIVKEREQLRQENAADFHDELGSLVTKISLFLTMAERSWQEKEDPSPFFKKIRNNVKGLSTGFRDLLWVIDPQKDTLADTFLRLKDFGEDLFDNGPLEFSTSTFEDDFSDRVLDPQTKKQVMMIFKEAMTNCLKYSDGSNVVLRLIDKGKFFKIELFDDGSGFDVEKKSKGRGLKNMRTRAEKIKANLSIESSGQGTSVLLDRIPHMGDIFSLQDD